MSARRLWILAGCAGTAASLQTSAPAAGELSSRERQSIDSGRQVVHEEIIRGSSWPRVSVYQFVDAAPQEAAAVFADYARHVQYIPGLTKSAISRRVSGRVTEVDYVLRVPIFPDEHYTVRDSLSTYDDGGSYRVDWVMVRARSTKAIVGSVRFEPYRNVRTGAEGTLIAYVNFVSPGQSLAGPLKGRALKQVRETVSALGERIESARSVDRVLLEQQIAMLVAALSM